MVPVQLGVAPARRGLAPPLVPSLAWRGSLALPWRGRPACGHGGRRPAPAVARGARGATRSAPTQPGMPCVACPCPAWLARALRDSPPCPARLVHARSASLHGRPRPSRVPSMSVRGPVPRRASRGPGTALVRVVRRVAPVPSLDDNVLLPLVHR
jgi:hypothetical protein